MRSVKGDWNDSVTRLLKFRADHPDITITPPDNRTLMWKARQGTDLLVERFSLGGLMDVLEARDS
jgi:hypothetical protein